MIGALAAGCTVVDENPDWSPQSDYPAWMYDAPFYHRPSEDLPVLETLNGIPIYHSRSEYFFIRHPAGCQVVGEPRMGVWYSTNHGQAWEKSGFFGVEQSHFLFGAESDGQYWIRFVGPGQGTSTVPPGMPHRIYMVDRQPPRIVLRVTPSAWQDAEKKIPRRFKVGQDVNLRWLIRDRCLDKNSSKLELCFAKFPHNSPWLTVPEKTDLSGTMTIEIPKKAADDGGIRFRLSARDLAGNIGVAMTDILHVISDKPPTLVARVKAVKADDPVQQTQGTPGKRLGWPAAGAMLRGGATRVLGWLPESAGNYGSVDLEFSANDAQTWHIVAKDLKAGQKINWTVPMVNSKNSRLRIVGLDKQKRKCMIIMGPRFTVTTVAPADTLGPILLPLPQE